MTDQAKESRIPWAKLKAVFEGDIENSKLYKIAYSTDASVYREIPVGVVFPRTARDIQEVVKWAGLNGITLIPRSGGTSLAGQCVGNGLVVDVSRYMNRIISIDKNSGLATVEPGMIRDVLNSHVASDGWFFGPNTSTSNRCTLGGMVANNSSGTTSIKFGVTRDKIVGLECVLADGSLCRINSNGEITALDEPDSGIGDTIHSGMSELMAREGVPALIESKFPKKEIDRRNTGYALDALLERADSRLPLAKLIAGSEGTLCMITQVTVELDPLPPAHVAVICAHFESINAAMLATVELMSLKPYACELMDKAILDLTKENPEQNENRFFVEGDPGAIIALEVRGESDADLELEVNRALELISERTTAFASPVVRGSDTIRVWNLRAAGLGVLSNVPGDKKPVAFVEDTAVALADLPTYIEAFGDLMKSFDQEAIYYAHAGAGELHLRPILDLKSAEGQRDFRRIAEASAELVKKYRGSLSGEHGDGRVRGELIKSMVGEELYDVFREVKRIWDPTGMFNPGKIVDASPLDANFRYGKNQPAFKFPTFTDFGDENMQQLAERCNGSADCRKPAQFGATMCPSYQVTQDEKDSTRGRANILREVLTRPENPAYPMDSEELVEALDLCLSCKACKRECPSSVDVAALKAEAMYQYHKRHGYTKAQKFFGTFHQQASRVWPVRSLVNSLLSNSAVSGEVKKRYNIAEGRTIPPFSKTRASKAISKYSKKNEGLDFVFLVDEFTEFQDSEVAVWAARFFEKLGLNFKVIYGVSGRAAISKSLLPLARKEMEKTLQLLEKYIDAQLPIIGMEPSAILGFRDDAPRLVSKKMKLIAEKTSKLVLTFEEYVADLIERKKITPEMFTDSSRELAIHLHCHQKAESHIKYSKLILNFPKNYKAVAIPSGCCGMAGSFGYEKEKFELSNQIGEQVLFPFIRMYPEKTIVASGTSCRHQIKDGVDAQAVHPARVLFEALK